MILPIIIGGAIAIIAFIIGSVSATQPLPPCCMHCLYDGCKCLQFSPYCHNHYGIGDLRKELQYKSDEINRLHQELWLAKKESSKVIYAKSEKEQHYVDLIKSSLVSAEELAKKLKIDTESL